MKKNTGVIYAIENKVNGKMYIGQTINLKRRWANHKSKLKNNKHINQHLQNSYNKYGKSKFKYKIIERNIPVEKLEEKETYYIHKYNSFKGGYNLKKYGERGVIFSKKTLQKISKNNARYWEGKSRNELTGKKISKALIGEYKGAQNPHSIKKEIGLKIYNEYKDKNVSQQQLSKKYNISNVIVGHICRGEHWSTKGFRPIQKTYLKGKNHPASKIIKKQGVKIFRDYYQQNINQKQLAKKYNVSRCTINSIVNCKHWTTKHLVSQLNNKKRK